MMTEFCKQAFDVHGYVDIRMADGRQFISNFPKAAWKWLDGKDWSRIDVYDEDFGQFYGWDRF